MNGFMTPRRPAGTLLQAHGVIRAADEDGSTPNLLEVAFEAKVGIANGQQLGVDAAMRRVACRATFTQRLMFEDIRTALGGMTLETVLCLGEQRRAAADMNAPLVRWMALNASHPALGNWMVAGQFKLAANVQVALVTHGFLRPHRRDCGNGSQANR